LAVIRERLPLTAVCAYVCTHPCEAKCGRRQLDEAVAIRALKRAAVEFGDEAGERQIPAGVQSGKKVAVVGAGPAGLTAAYYLCKQGHRVVVFEALPEAGGMMRYGIPEYRLPRDLLDREIAEIAALGVDIRTNNMADSLEQLQADGYDALLLASGAWQGVKAGIEGEASAGAMDALSFLREVKSGGRPAIGPRVVVVGGGNTAVDAARTALRLGARSVVILYRRTRAEMPASAEEIDGALEEGVEIEYLAAPVRITEREGVCKVVCQRMQLGEKDDTGRPSPTPIKGSEFDLSCDQVLIAVGQTGGLGGNFGLSTRPNGSIEVDSDTLETSRKGVFAAGDAVTGPASIIDAIAQGRLAASSIDRFLGGGGLDDGSVRGPAEAPVVSEARFRGTCRPHMPTIPIDQRLTAFAAVELGYEKDAAVREARRCLACDVRDYRVEVDVEACKECRYCAAVCRMEVFSPATDFNRRGYRPMVAARQDRCVGCMDCFFVCPDFAIEIVKVG
ncbi:MAG: FAD-dependent oxidoreductase, partial [Chloroflexota bacterium]